MTITTSTRRLASSIGLLAGLLSLPAFADPAAPVARTTVEGLLNATGSCPTNWSYDGSDNGPAQWATMPHGYPDCSGDTQSPIDVHKFSDEKADALVFSYTAAPLSVFNTGMGLQVASTAFGTAGLPNGPWTLMQFHFHFPSEHTYKGKTFDGEVHLVHQNASGDLAVVAVFVQHGPANAAFQLVADSHPSACNTQAAADSIDPTALLPERQDYFVYSGSLTTPPCSDNVTFYVMHHPIQASSEQMAQLAAGLRNARPLQHNGNAVTYFKTP